MNSNNSRYSFDNQAHQPKTELMLSSRVSQRDAMQSKTVWPHYVFISCALLLFCLWHNQLHAQEVAGHHIALNAIKAGELLYKTPNASRYQPAVMLNSHVEMSIHGLIASVTVTQQFVNDSGQWQEAVYAFPLPENSAVNSMQIQVADIMITGEIKEKQQAKAIYRAAKKEGKRAALLEQQRPNLFTSQVANIPPGETVSVTITYLQELEYKRGSFSLRFPMTLTPRYIPGVPLLELPETTLAPDPSSGWAKASDLVPDADKITPYQHPTRLDSERMLNPIDFNITLAPGLALASLTSPSHTLAINKKANQYQLSLASGKTSMDRDFILKWQPEPSQAPQAALFSEQHKGEHYALMMLLPPTQHGSAHERLAKEQVFVIDVSGSMSGAPIRQAKQSLLTAVNALASQDSFNIIAFSSEHHALFQTSVKASRDNIKLASRYIRSLEAGGGTEMAGALSAAFKQNKGQGAGPSVTALRQVIFITDGAVGNEQQLFSLIHKELATSRLFTVGIGSAPNSHFMRSAAKFGKGSFSYIANEQQIQAKMNTLLQQLSSPAMTKLRLSIAGAELELGNTVLPDLYHQQAVLLTAKLSAPQGKVTLSGQTAKQHWQTSLSLSSGKQAQGISALWARERITALLDSKVLGAAPELIREQVTQLALANQLVSPYTSFVAVEQKISRKPEAEAATTAIANVKPHQQQLAYPKTASNARLHLLIGLALICLLLILELQKKRQWL